MLTSTRARSTCMMCAGGERDVSPVGSVINHGGESSSSSALAQMIQGIRHKDFDDDEFKDMPAMETDCESDEGSNWPVRKVPKRIAKNKDATPSSDPGSDKSTPSRSGVLRGKRQASASVAEDCSDAVSRAASKNESSGDYSQLSHPLAANKDTSSIQSSDLSVVDDKKEDKPAEPQQVDPPRDTVHLGCPVLSKKELRTQEEQKSRWCKGSRLRRGKAAKLNEQEQLKEAFKGQNIRKRLRIHPQIVKGICRGSGRVCSCFKSKGVNHFEYVTEDMAKHYRYFLHDPEDEDLSGYMRRYRAHELIKACHESTRQERFMKSGKHGGDNIKYHLWCPFREKRIPLCCPLFAEVLGLDESTIRRIRSRVVKHLPPEETFRAPVASPQYLAIHTFLEGLAEDLANESPDLTTVELPMGRKNHYYMLFAEGWKPGVLSGVYTQGNRTLDPDMPPSIDLFYKVWRRDFNALRVPKRSNRFSKCETCIERRQAVDNARQLRDSAAILKTKQELLGHYKWVTLQRKVYHNDRAAAGTNPAG